MIRLLVFTPEPLLLLAVSKVIEDQSIPTIALSGGVCVPSEVVREVVLHQPDVVLVGMSEGMSWDVLRTIRIQSPSAKIVLWTNQLPAETAFELMELGLRGILRREVTPALLLRCIAKVHEGELWFEKAFTDSILCSRKVRLSRRESELVRLLTQGLKNKEIAWSLKITEGTVKVYLSKLFAKTGAKDRLDLALIGLKHLPESSLGTNSSPAGWSPQPLFLKATADASSSSTTAEKPKWDQRTLLVS